MSMDVGGGKSVNSDINVTPFCDVVLVLLIIFMVITPMLQKGKPVDLPNSRNPQDQAEADKESSLVIAIPTEDSYYIGKDGLPFEALREQIGEDYQKNPAQPVFIKATKTLPFLQVKRVLKSVQDTGFKKVALLTQHVDEKGNVVSGSVNSKIPE